jgi:hypothetical protein
MAWVTAGAIPWMLSRMEHQGMASCPLEELPPGLDHHFLVAYAIHAGTLGVLLRPC